MDGGDGLGVAACLLGDRRRVVEAFEAVHGPLVAQAFGECPVDLGRAAGGVHEEERGRSPVRAAGVPDRSEPVGHLLDGDGAEQIAQRQPDGELALQGRADPDRHQRVQSEVGHRGGGVTRPAGWPVTVAM